MPKIQHPEPNFTGPVWVGARRVGYVNGVATVTNAGVLYELKRLGHRVLPEPPTEPKAPTEPVLPEPPTEPVEVTPTPTPTRRRRDADN